MNLKFVRYLLLGGVLLSMSTPLFAAATGGGALPWEAPLTALVTSITGPVAFSIAVIGIVIAGGMLIFGADLNRFGQAIIYLVLVIGFMVVATNLMQSLFGLGALPGAGSLIAFVTIGAVMLSAVAAALQLRAMSIYLEKRGGINGAGVVAA